VTIKEEADKEQSAVVVPVSDAGAKHFARHVAIADSNKVDGWKPPPLTLAAAHSSLESGHWEGAINEELASLSEKEVGVLMPLPPGRKAVGSRWVYSHKYDKGG